MILNSVIVFANPKLISVSFPGFSKHGQIPPPLFFQLFEEQERGEVNALNTVGKPLIVIINKQHAYSKKDNSPKSNC